MKIKKFVSNILYVRLVTDINDLPHLLFKKNLSGDGEMYTEYDLLNDNSESLFNSIKNDMIDGLDKIECARIFILFQESCTDLEIKLYVDI